MNQHESCDTWPAAALDEGCRTVGLDGADAVAVHRGHCACFALPQQRLFIRVGRPGTDRQALNAIRFARACAGVLPVLSPAAIGHGQPVLTQDGPVTFWPLMETVHAEVDYDWLGATLRRLHDWPTCPGLEHQQTDASVVRSRLRRYGDSPNGDPAVARACFELIGEIEDGYQHILPRLATGFIHGDAYPTNVLTTADGAFLVDYDSAGIGPRYWDLAPVMVAKRRFGLSARSVDRLFDGYGQDPRGDPAFWAVVRIRELGAITYLLDRAATDKRFAAELGRRLNSRSSGTWTPLADLELAEGAAAR